MPERLGIIQSRGIGDIIIALPIAKWYHDRGIEVHWPIDARFLPSFESAVDYVRFIPFPFEPTAEGFVHRPLRLLKAVPCQQIVSLYSYLSNCAVNVPALFHSFKFDEYKYAVAGVPFAQKWRLKLKRNPERERAFYDRVVRSENYVVVHRQGSSAKTDAAIPAKFKDHQVIAIEELTDCIFDWLLVLERAKFLLLLDSCFANLVEQLGFPNEKIFVLRSEVRFTPVLRSNWSYCGAKAAA